MHQPPSEGSSTLPARTTFLLLLHPEEYFFVMSGL
jgi:hypothetical protein